MGGGPFRRALLGGLVAWALPGAVIAQTPAGPPPAGIEHLDRMIGLDRARSAEPDPARPPAAGDGLRIGAVNAMLVYIFHPKMMDYVRLERNFIRPLGPTMTADERTKRLRERWYRSQEVYASKDAVRKRAVARHDELNRARVKAYDQFKGDEEKAIREGRQEVIGRPTQAETIERGLAARLKALEKGYWEEIARLAREEEKLQAEVDAVNDEVVGQALLTRRERDREVESILGDIEEGIDKAREEQGLLVVVNEAFLPRQPVRTREGVHFEPFPANLFVYSNLYREFLESSKAPGPREHGLHWLGTRPDRERWLLERYYQDRFDLGQHFWNSQANRFVWTGIQDITSSVLEHVLTKHRLPEAKRREVLAFVEAVRKKSF